MLVCSIVLLFGRDKLGRFLTYMVVLYCAGLAFFRGDVGTDTNTYIRIFDLIYNGYYAPFTEVGFTLLARVLLLFGNSSDGSVKAVSLVFFALVTIFVTRATKDELFVIAALLLPATAYQYSMNVLRLGIAFALFLVLFQRSLRYEHHRGFSYSLASSLFHISSVFYFFFLSIFMTRWRSRRLLGALLLGAALLAAISYFNLPYLLGKLDLYSDYESPGALSGMRILVPVLVMLMGIVAGRISSLMKAKLVLVSLATVAAALGLARVSYAGLRLLDLLLLSIPLAVIYSYNEEDKAFDMNVKLSLLLAGNLFAAGTYIGFDASFLPYSMG